MIGGCIAILVLALVHRLCRLGCGRRIEKLLIANRFSMRVFSKSSHDKMERMIPIFALRESRIGGYVLQPRNEAASSSIPILTLCVKRHRLLYTSEVARARHSVIPRSLTYRALIVTILSAVLSFG